jgi:hypothetical protein
MGNLFDMVSAFDEGLVELSKTVGELRISRQAPGRQVFAAALICRIFTNLTGIQILYRQQLPTETATLLRSGLETIFWLGAIAHDDAFIEKVVQQDNTSRRSLAKNLLNRPLHTGQLDTEQMKALRLREQNKSPDGGLGKLDVVQAADAAGLGDWYPVYLVYSNKSAHPSAASLEKHLEFDAVGDLVGFVAAPPSEQEWLQIMTDACGLIFQTWHFLNEIYLNPERGWPEKLMERYHELVKAQAA